MLDQYDDAELDRKKTAAMFAGFITKTAPEEQLLGEIEATDMGGAIASLEPCTMQATWRSATRTASPSCRDSSTG